MSNERKPDMSCARVETYTASKIGPVERHNERKNKDYGNVNVIEERIPLNISFKDTGGKSYMELLREKEANGEISLRGLRSDAKLFDEIVFDVNTRYFEEHGGYEYAKLFFEEAYHFAVEKYGGEERIISAVMHADEINKAVSDELGKDVYHYHLHLVALPVVEKEIKWSKRCTDPALVGTVKEVIHQISHSKKWESREPMLDDYGNPILRKDGSPKFVQSYSVLQDEFFHHMTEHGFTDFQRGERGSTAEHLTSLQYQIEKDRERLSEIDEKMKSAKLQYEPAKEIYKTYSEIEDTGKKTLTGKYTMSKEEYEDLTKLAKEGITSRGKIGDLQNDLKFYKNRAFDYSSSLDRLQEKYDKLKEICKPFLTALEHFPNLVRKFTDTVRDLFSQKEAREQAERERKRAEEEKARQERKAKQKSKGWER